MAAGSISASEFTNQANIFFKLSVRNNDIWELKSSQNDCNEVYLCKKCHVGVAMDTREDLTISNQELSDDNDDSSDTDAACPSMCPSSRSECLFEYHIVYSPSYAVPVLYFNAYTPGGSLLPLETIWKNVPSVYQERLKNEKWTVLTQQEHPILARPFFQLHPCHTADLMKNIPASHKNSYLVGWLSAVGPVVGLNLPLSYADG